jgi:hypothetical protein
MDRDYSSTNLAAEKTHGDEKSLLS